MNIKPTIEETRTHALYVAKELFFIEAVTYTDGKPVVTFVGSTDKGADTAHELIDAYMDKYDRGEKCAYRIWRATVDQVIPSGADRKIIREKMLLADRKRQERKNRALRLARRRNG